MQPDAIDGTADLFDPIAMELPEPPTSA